MLFEHKSYWDLNLCFGNCSCVTLLTIGAYFETVFSIDAYFETMYSIGAEFIGSPEIDVMQTQAVVTVPESDEEHGE